ncbi:MAG: hypothetical protein HQ512_14360 [Rhodospirillales bacterium]|nr:hypothetical protein [Rhodospirillales bacterium]
MRSSKKAVFVAGMAALLVAAMSGSAGAGEASVVGAVATASGGGTYTFSATISHADTGWDHYANKFDILAPDGTLLGTRVLYHPHVGEQPFTRSHTIKIPAGIKSVIVRAGDKVHKDGKKTFTVKLPER